MIGWMYSGSPSDTSLTTEGQNQNVGGKTGLRTFYRQTNGSSAFVGFVTMDIAPSFIQNDSLVAESHHFPDRQRFGPGHCSTVIHCFSTGRCGPGQATDLALCSTVPGPGPGPTRCLSGK